MRFNFLNQRHVTRTSDELFFPPDHGPREYVPPERVVSDSPTLERRREDRQPYPCLQRLTARVPQKSAAEATLDQVRCHDICRAGISYWAHQAPDGNEVLIDLGSDPDCLRVVAEIRHATEVSCLDRSLFLVGCRIVSKC